MKARNRLDIRITPEFVRRCESMRGAKPPPPAGWNHEARTVGTREAARLLRVSTCKFREYVQSGQVALASRAAGRHGHRFTLRALHDFAAANGMDYVAERIRQHE